MKIKAAANATGVSKRNIHFYIQEGLLQPSAEGAGKYYDFSEDDCKRLIFIRRMRDAGLSVQAIRSMLSDPVTAPFYLNRQIRAMKREQRHLEQTLISLQYMLEELPLFPDFSSLWYVAEEAGIPEFPVPEYESEFDRYSTSVINRFLWGGFLPEGDWTDYQEYLWMKLNRMTAENPSEDYLRLARTLYSMDSHRINALLVKKADRYHIVADLTADTLPGFCEQMLSGLADIVSHPEHIRFWKNTYADFFGPTTSIQASPLSKLVMELSPFYKRYVENIVAACEKVYAVLLSPEGAELYSALKNACGDAFRPEGANHGELEAMLVVPTLYRLLKLD